MTGLVTVTVVPDMAEAEATRRVLERAGIATTLQGAEGDFEELPHDGPCRLLVADALLDRAREALAEAADEEEDEGDL